MNFHKLPIQDAKLIQLAPERDERGFFVRNFCKELFTEHDLPYDIIQTSTSFNYKSGTLRGLHFQKAPYEEGKFIQCVAGKIYDVIVDLRTTSATYGQWHAETLLASEHKILYAPKGCAHGFVTLVDNTEIYYAMDQSYHPESSAGILWNSPALKITWPEQDPALSVQDSQWPAFELSQG